MHQYLGSILPVFYLGVGLNVFCCILMLILVFHPALAKNIMLTCLKFLVKLHIMKDKPERMEKLSSSMDMYNATAAYLKKHIGVIVNVILITFAQRAALFFVTYFVYRSFGLHGAGIYNVVMLQAVISVSVDMLPLPGGMGISEQLFLAIFVPVFGSARFFRNGAKPGDRLLCTAFAFRLYDSRGASGDWTRSPQERVSCGRIY